MKETVKEIENAIERETRVEIGIENATVIVIVIEIDVIRIKNLGDQHLARGTVVDQGVKQRKLLLTT